MPGGAARPGQPGGLAPPGVPAGPEGPRRDFPADGASALGQSFGSERRVRATGQNFRPELWASASG
ncbi:MAG: hypothetical protein AAF317_03960, partial [Pseudomonadota bacterium]